MGKQTKFHRHLVRGIENTEENRKKISDINKLMRKSDSTSRLIIKYRKPREGYNSNGDGKSYSYTDGSVRKEDGTIFSIYLTNSPAYNDMITDIRIHAHERANALAERYNKLVAKINTEKLNAIIEQLQDDVNDLGHQPVNVDNWKELARSLASLGIHVGFDLKELEDRA